MQRSMWLHTGCQDREKQSTRPGIQCWLMEVIGSASLQWSLIRMRNSFGWAIKGVM
ncbi:hypothetical protein JYU34_006083 [Plutella xylostella]|uniref:Uncharacterized protein n=1 Tax=Plutella xylostella TaxID=51655 RepID=A0ABQ7QUZ6_PLUXY|nr:hypothetical protein JYU34_006083 [Plutella xylostella]